MTTTVTPMERPTISPFVRSLEDARGEVSDCSRAGAAEDVEVAVAVRDDSESVVVSRGIVWVMNVVSRGTDENSSFAGRGLGINPGRGA